uniref:Sdr Family Oxidoreductase n=1 Tax=Florenciella sp. virus SA2 TaxID=3240092 RepID=A0AB39JE48_9VIRU
MTHFDLSNKTILIFGGTGVLMSKMAEVLADQNATVIIIGRDKSKIKHLLENKKIHFYKFDIYINKIEILFEMVYSKYKYVDMLINGAGVNSSTPLLDIKYNEMINIFNINFFFVINCCQVYIKKTLELGKPGKILNIGSISGLTPLSNVYMYSASKSALHNFSKNIAREYGSKNINTNILIPGFFPAEQNKEILTEKRKNKILQHTPSNRFGEPSDLAGIVSLLASDSSEFINGAELVIDGGFNATKI